MSRIGKKPVDIPSGVNVTLLDSTIKVKGPKGELQWSHPFGTKVSVAANSIVVERADDFGAVGGKFGVHQRRCGRNGLAIVALVFVTREMDIQFRDFCQLAIDARVAETDFKLRQLGDVVPVDLLGPVQFNE